LTLAARKTTLPSPVPSDVLECYANHEYHEIILPTERIEDKPNPNGIEDKDVLCIICGDVIGEGSNFPFLNDPDGYLTLCPEKDLKSDQLTSLLDHVKFRHHTIPFAFMDKWKTPHDTVSTDMRALIQEALDLAYREVGGLDLGLFARLNETGSDTLVKARLSLIFGYALCYTKQTLPNNLKKRRQMKKWSVDIAPDSKPLLQMTWKAVDVNIVRTGLKWIRLMEECCVTFDFVAFLGYHKGNWRCIWNSMVYFFRRGLYFENTYPPVHALRKVVCDENFNIITQLNKVLGEIQEDKALREECDEYETKRKAGDECETWERRKKKRRA
jgi:hypothetical protein